MKNDEKMICVMITIIIFTVLGIFAWNDAIPSEYRAVVLIIVSIIGIGFVIATFIPQKRN